MGTMGANPPDILVIVETSTGAGDEGTLITAGGQQVALDLLNRLRSSPVFGPNWMLVPPVILGEGKLSEGISVYYNSANLHFSGPFGWPGAPNCSGSLITLGGVTNLVNYAAPWQNCLPATAVPAASNINPGINMNCLAGQWLFADTGNPANRLQFPGTGNRPPYLTTFWDAANNRTIKLLSYHAPPNHWPAANGTNQLANVQEMTTNLAANEVGVIVGDFNVDLFDHFYEPLAYNNLIGPAGYTRQINPTAAVWPDKGYVSTHIKLGNQAKPWYTNGYPGYSYTGSNPKFQGYDSIDNILTRYGAAAGGGQPSNITIINRVTGTPYNMDPNPPVGVPAGHYAYTTCMSQFAMGPNAGLPIALPLPTNGPTGVGGVRPGTIGGLSQFRGWDNYGHIRSTSDHFALIVDI